jgi:hypothetical protein
MYYDVLFCVLGWSSKQGKTICKTPENSKQKNTIKQQSKAEAEVKEKTQKNILFNKF